MDHEIYKNVPPLGLLYLGYALKKAEYKVKIHHILENDIQRCCDEILNEQPLWIGFSVVTGWNLKPAAELSRLLKRKSDIPIVWGNVHPTHLPEQCLSEEYIDIVCLGEGEESAVELATALEEKRSISRIKGIGFKNEGGRIIINQRRPLLQNLDQYEADWSLVDIRRYIVPSWGMKRTLRVIASRGCPYNCTFCYNTSFNMRRWRCHSPNYIIDRLNRLADKFDIEAFYFNDDNLFANQTWAWQILENINRPYYASARPEYIDANFAERLSKTRCKEVLIGFESGSDPVLKNILKKGSSSKQHEQAVENLSRHPEMKIDVSFITALPDETPEDFQKTREMINFILEAHPNQRIILAFYRPLPGTELYKLALKRGFKAPRDTEGWFVFDCLANRLDLPWMDKDTTEQIEALCQSLDVLAALYKFNVPLLKGFVRNAIRKEDYRHRLLLFLNKVRIRYAFDGMENRRTILLRRLVNKLKAWKRLD